MSDENSCSKSIFLEAVENYSPREWPDLLDDTCANDPELRAKVERLLSSHQSLGTFHDSSQSIADRTCLFDSSAIALDSEIGPYKIRERLGEGGMGVVYVAQQTSPIRRKVALKLIKAGMDSQEVIARFEAERQTLALMSHPNIAKVLDGGTTENCRPYFVMELVKGRSITEFCDEQQLTVRERLELFITVCQAVQHAHLKGIIHRDLKPSNVLVELHDVNPVPKVIDFGIAKAINRQLTQQTIYTQFSQVVGTPLYMSPEQAQLSSLDIDTRSDVYSLGVMLYELLVGTTPFDGETLDRVGLDEMRRIIREDNLLPPSGKISTLDVEKLSTVSQCRKAHPRELSLSLQRELDWIVLQTLEKDRSRRYESASDLAQDIQRYLNNEPVEACPPSTVYRFRKFVQNNLAFLIATSLILATTLIGTLTSLWYANKANSAAIIAEGNAEVAEQRTTDLRQMLYAADIKLASQFWKEGDLRNFTDVLNRYANVREGEADLRGFEWWYLSELAKAESELLAKRDEQACLVRFSPDGKHLLLGWTDGRVDLLDATSSQVLFSLQTDNYFVDSCDFHPEGSQLATIGDDGKIILWDLETQQRIRTIQACEKHAHRVFFNSDGTQLVSSGEEGRLRFWETRTGKLVGEITGFNNDEHGGVERRLACSPTRERLAAGDGRGLAAVYDFRSREKLFLLEGINDSNPLVRLRYSHQGHLLAGATTKNRIHLWNAHDGRLLQSFDGHRDDVKDLTFHPSGNLIASSDRGGIIRCWKIDSPGQTLRHSNFTWPEAFRAHEDRVLSIDFSNDGKRLVSGSRDLTVRHWNGRGVESRLIIETPSPRDVLFVRGGSELLIGCEQRIERWNRNTGQLQQLASFSQPLENLVTDGKEEKFVTSHNEGWIRVWEGEPPQLSTQFRADPRRRESLALSPDGCTLFSSTFGLSTTGIQRLDDRDFNAPEQTLDEYDRCWLSPDGLILVAHRLDEIHAFDANSLRLIHKYRGHTNRVYDSSFTSDSRLMVSGSHDRSVRIWETKIGKLLHTILAHDYQVREVVFSPDGRTVVSGDDRGHIVFSHVASGRVMFETMVAERPVSDLEFSPDGRLLAIVQPESLILLGVPEAPVFNGNSSLQAFAKQPQQ